MPTPADLPKTTETTPALVEETSEESTPIHDELTKGLADADPVDVSRFAPDEDDDPTQFAGEFVEDEEETN